MGRAGESTCQAAGTTCKGSEAGAGLVCLGKGMETRVAMAEQTRVRVQEVRAEQEWGSDCAELCGQIKDLRFSV